MAKPSRPERGGVESIRVGALEAAPGTCVHGDIPVARLPTQGWLELPVAVFNGARPGPRIWVSAAIHGDELNGVEVVRELVEQLDPAKLAGALVAAPVVNVFGFTARSRYTPDGRDLNRVFPGNKRGSLASRLAALFMGEIVAQCELGIDLHTAAEGRTNVPQVRCDTGQAKLRELAAVFGSSIVLHSRPGKGTLRGAAAKKGIPVLLFEGGGPHTFDRAVVREGLNGLKRIMNHLDMYHWRVPKVSRAPVEYSSSRWLRAPCSGLFRPKIAVGAKVQQGQILGSIGDTLGGSPREVRALFDGRVIGGATHPLVHQGDALLHVAQLEG